MNFMHKSALALLFTLTAMSVRAQEPASPERLDEVVERGRHVMPFDLEKTQHVFDKTEHGGIQQVIAKEPGDTEQIGLIRRHLSELAERFRQGDFSRQQDIHGDDMPGLADLAANYTHVRFDYRELPNGAEIEFSSEDTELVDAIHRYFNAQLSDHARHAVDGQTHQYQHKSHRHHGVSKSIGSKE